MNIDTQIVYIVILLFTCLVLLCITLIYLYISILNKYTKVKDDPQIDNAKKIADKIVNTAKDLDQKHDSIMSKIVDQIALKWQTSAEIIFTKNAKVLDEELKKTVESLYKKEILNLDLYKKEKMEEFDSLISDFVNTTGRQILKKEINLNDHKKLISDGLERAKKVGLFK